MFEDRIRLLDKLHLCADKARIAEHQFISFGTLLGAVRPTLRRPNNEPPYYARGIMQHDKDMDIGFLADKFQPGQRETYYHYCHEEGLFSWPKPSHRIRKRQDNNDILWFSTKLGKQRCCQWFFFKFKDYLFHSKGAAWNNERKFSFRKYPRMEDAQSVMLGAPARYFDKLIEIEFEGIRVNVPLRSGSLLDWWYRGWHTPHKGGASGKRIVGIVQRWDDQKSWKIL